MKIRYLKKHLNCHLAFNMRERHIILYDSIGFKEKEQIAMKMVTNLIIGCSAYILFGTLLEAIFFNLYNSMFHPFGKILDISNVSQGKLVRTMGRFI